MARKPLTPDEVAEFLQVSRFTVYELVKRGELPAFRVGRQVRVDPDALDAYITGRHVDVPLVGRTRQAADDHTPTQVVGPADGPAAIEQRVGGAVGGPAGAGLTATAGYPVPAGQAVTDGATLTIAASHDLALELLGRRLKAPDSTRPGLRPSFVGSLAGLLALHRGQAAVAGAHLWDRDSDTYNLPYIRRIFPGRRMLVLHLVRRLQGFLVAPDNPLDIHSWHDLARPEVRLINRQPGSGTRVLLDDQLAARGIDPARVNGYRRETATHAGAAGAVASGEADVAVGIYAAARGQGLSFVPLLQERYDLVMPHEVYGSPALTPFLDILEDREVRREVESLGGYDASDMGRVLA